MKNEKGKTITVTVVDEINGGRVMYIHFLWHSISPSHTLSVPCPISDNGAWMQKGLDGGSNGLLRGEKGSTWEGGLR